MHVLALTILLSLVLAGFFCLFFLRNQGNADLSSPERDALLPFNDEAPENKATSKPGNAINQPLESIASINKE